MKCSTCGAWSRVLSTRTEEDGYTVRRRHECANMHRFTSVQVMASVYCSAKQRNTAAIATAKRRAALFERNAVVRKAIAGGEQQKAIAARLGLSPSTINLIHLNKL